MARRNYETGILPFYEDPYYHDSYQDWESEALADATDSHSQNSTLVDDLDDLDDDLDYYNEDTVMAVGIECFPLRFVYRNGHRVWVINLGTTIPVILALEGMLAVGLFWFWLRSR